MDTKKIAFTTKNNTLNCKCMEGTCTDQWAYGYKCIPIETSNKVKKISKLTIALLNDDSSQVKSLIANRIHALDESSILAEIHAVVREGHKEPYVEKAGSKYRSETDKLFDIETRKQVTSQRPSENLQVIKSRREIEKLIRHVDAVAKDPTAYTTWKNAIEFCLTGLPMATELTANNLVLDLRYWIADCKRVRAEKRQQKTPEFLLRRLQDDLQEWRASY